MDYIRLDRVQPFASPLDTTTTTTRSVSPPTVAMIEVTQQQPEINKESSTPVQSPSPVQAPLSYTQTQLRFEPHTNAVVTLPPVEINLDQLRTALETASIKSFGKHCTSIVPPVPLINDIIPIFASTFEIVDYQQAVRQAPSILHNLTIAEVLHSFSNPKKVSKSLMTSKLLFLQRLIAKSSRMAVNFDFAVVCHSKENEDALYFMLSEVLTYFGEKPTKIPLEHYPVTGRTKISTFSPSSNLYGIIFKHRKHAKDMNLTFKRSVDMVLVYDSACRVGEQAIFELFEGTHTLKPHLRYLSIADSADIRIHYYNSLSPPNRIDWNTKISDLNELQLNSLLYQPNRAIHKVGDVCGWIDAASQSLINWVSTKSKSEFTFSIPTKGRMGQLYKEFNHRSPEQAIPRSALKEGTAALLPPSTSPSGTKLLPQAAKKRKVSPQPIAPPSKKAKKKAPSPPKQQDRRVTFEQGTKKSTPSSTIITKTIHNTQASTSPMNTIHPERLNHIANVKRSRDEYPSVQPNKKKSTEQVTQNEYLPDLRVSLPFPTASGYVLNPVSNPYRLDSTPIASPASSSSSHSSPVADSRGLSSSSVRIIDDPIEFTSSPASASTSTSTGGGSDVTGNLTYTYYPKREAKAKAASSQSGPAPVATPSVQPTSSTSSASSDPAEKTVSLVPSSSSNSNVASSSSQKSTVSFAAEISSNLDNLFSEALKQFEMEMDALSSKKF